MAKKKTSEDLIQEAKKIMLDARKKQAALIQEAKELESKKFIELGKKCVEFLEDKISKDELLVSANKLELVSIIDEELENYMSLKEKEVVANV